MKLTIDDVRSRFVKHFDGETGSVYASPGRINLIGEHTDYNNGFVFPGAVEQGMIAEIKPNGTRNVRAYSIDFKDYVEFNLDDEAGPKATWARYIFGVCREMMALGVPVEGFNTAFAGDVPLGAGMSSSAALESTYAFALNDLWGDNKIEKMELARVGQRTEHKYVGCNCGIMDQFASVFGRKGSLMRLDCRSGEYQYFPWHPKGYQLILVNSCVKHILAGSPYNERRLQCEHVAEIISERERLAALLPSLPCVLHVYPSDANFFLVKVTDADRVYDYLVQHGIIVRNRNRVLQCEGCLRLTIGTPAENDRLLHTLASCQ